MQSTKDGQDGITVQVKELHSNWLSTRTWNEKINVSGEGG